MPLTLLVLGKIGESPRSRAERVAEVKHSLTIRAHGVQARRADERSGFVPSILDNPDGSNSARPHGEQRGLDTLSPLHSAKNSSQHGIHRYAFANQPQTLPRLSSLDYSSTSARLAPSSAASWK
jgi:hypothetical protein